MSSESLIAEYEKSEDSDVRCEILHQIGDCSDEVGLRFLLLVMQDDAEDEDVRLEAVQSVKSHTLTPLDDHVFESLMNWLENAGSDEDIQVHATPIITFSGFDKEVKRRRIMNYLTAQTRSRLVSECLMTDIGIHGRGKFDAMDISALKGKGLDDIVEFIIRQWRRQQA